MVPFFGGPVTTRPASHSAGPPSTSTALPSSSSPPSKFKFDPFGDEDGPAVPGAAPLAKPSHASSTSTQSSSSANIHHLLSSMTSPNGSGSGNGNGTAGSGTAIDPAPSTGVGTVSSGMTTASGSGSRKNSSASTSAFNLLPSTSSTLSASSPSLPMTLGVPPLPSPSSGKTSFSTTSSSSHPSPITNAFANPGFNPSFPNAGAGAGSTSVSGPIGTHHHPGTAPAPHPPASVHGHRMSSSQSSLHSISTRSSSMSVSSSSASGPLSSAMVSDQGTASKQPSTLSLRAVLAQPAASASNAQHHPPNNAPPIPPVAGFRVPATGSAQLATFPLLEMCGPAFADLDGAPVYVCSAILGNSVHPGKAGPHLLPPVRISFGGQELPHDGRYDLLPITPEMKWVQASEGCIPEGYTPIQGGYEESGEQLFHALARINGFWVPGKTAVHLQGANFPYAHREIRKTEGYRVLCWRKKATAPDINPADVTAMPDSPHKSATYP